MNKYKRSIFCIICFFTALGISAKTHYTNSDSVFVEKILVESMKPANRGNLQLFFAKKFLGKPYVAHTLEKFDKEYLIVNTRELDCTTLIDNVIALTLCAYYGQYKFKDYTDMLERVRYRHGSNKGYTSRLHYFSDWILDKTAMGLVKEIQSPTKLFRGVQQLHVDYMSKHISAYKALRKHPEYVPIIKRQEQALNGRTFRYIPKSMILNTSLMRTAVKDGDIIAIVSNKSGLDIAHLGIAIWRTDGLHMINASQIHHKVVEEQMLLYNYLKKHPSHIGIRVVRIITNK